MILDSCVWVGIASNQVERQSVIEAAGNSPVFISVISLGELGFGVESCKDPSERALRAAYMSQLEIRPTLEITKQTAASFGVLCASVKQLGRSPRPRYNDLWLAAQAIEHGYELLTLNIKDFVDLPGLRLASLES